VLKKRNGLLFYFILFFPLTLYYHRHREKGQQKEKKELGNWGQRGKGEAFGLMIFFFTREKN